jgi:hypothetical protein
MFRKNLESMVKKSAASALIVGLSLMAVGCGDDHDHDHAKEDPAEHACLHIKESSGTLKALNSGDQLKTDEAPINGLYEFVHLRFDVKLAGANPYMGNAWFETHEEGEILLFSATGDLPIVRTLPDSVIVVPESVVQKPSVCPEIKMYSTYDLPKGKVLIEWKNSPDSIAKIVLEEGGEHAH